LRPFEPVSGCLPELREGDLLDFLTSRGFTVHLSRDMVVLERAGMLADYPTLSEAYAAVKRMVNCG